MESSTSRLFAGSILVHGRVGKLPESAREGLLAIQPECRRQMIEDHWRHGSKSLSEELAEVETAALIAGIRERSMVAATAVIRRIAQKASQRC